MAAVLTVLDQSLDLIFLEQTDQYFFSCFVGYVLILRFVTMLMEILNTREILRNTAPLRL